MKEECIPVFYLLSLFFSIDYKNICFVVYTSQKVRQNVYI